RARLVRHVDDHAARPDTVETPPASDPDRRKVDSHFVVAGTAPSSPGHTEQEPAHEAWDDGTCVADLGDPQFLRWKLQVVEVASVAPNIELVRSIAQRA